MGKRGGAIRRKADTISPVRKGYIERLIKKVDGMNYGQRIGGGLTPHEQKLRNKALIAILYLSGRRISEFVGRIYKYKDGRVDVWEGVKREDFRVGKIEDENVLRVRLRILKRGRSKSTLKEIMVFIDIRLGDPLAIHILNWLKNLGDKHKGRVFAISRSRAWQILTKLDKTIWVHWFRHQRLTHLSDTMNPYELKEFGKFANLDTALNYIHKSPTKILAKVREADELWK